jgi:hypothetical protein
MDTPPEQEQKAWGNRTLDNEDDVFSENAWYIPFSCLFLGPTRVKDHINRQLTFARFPFFLFFSLRLL